MRTRKTTFYTVLFVILGLLGYVAHKFIGTFVIAIFLYYSVRPIYSRITTHTNKKSVTALISILSFILPIVTVLSYTIFVGIHELHVYSSQINIPYGQIQSVINAQFGGANPGEYISSTDPTKLSELVRTVAGYIGIITNLIFHLIVILAVVFYLLRDGSRVKSWFLTTFTNDQKLVSEYMHRVDDDLHNILFGNILHAVIISIVASILYNALNIIAPAPLTIPAPTLLGIITGLTSLIPVFGIKVVYISLTAYLTAKVHYTGLPEDLIWFPVIVLGVSFASVDGIPDIMLRSYVSGRHLHVGMVMLSYILGPMIFGWYGLFFAPILLILIYHFLTFVVPEYLQDRDMDGRPISFENGEVKIEHPEL